MTFIPLTRSNFEILQIESTIKKSYIKTPDETQGSLYIFPRRSKYQKQDANILEPYLDSHFLNLKEDVAKKVLLYLQDTTDNPDIASTAELAVTKYIDVINKLPISSRKFEKIDISRFDANSDNPEIALKKHSIIYPFYQAYRKYFNNINFAFVNYNCLNLKKCSINDNFALIYPNIVRGTDNAIDADDFGQYSLDDAFSFEFWINPRYVMDNPGTVLHLPGHYSISIFPSTGYVDNNNEINKFQVCLQLGADADLSPTAIFVDKTIATGKYVFWSTETALTRHHWHHIAIRWGGPDVESGQGSFVVDGVVNATFTLATTNIPKKTRTGTEEAYALIVGNFCEGDYETDPDNSLGRYFLHNFAQAYGVYDFELATSGVADDEPDPNRYDPLTLQYNNIANVDLQEIKIYSRFRQLNEIISSYKTGVSDLTDLKFYLPVLYDAENSPTKKVVEDAFLNKNIGGIPYTLSVFIDTKDIYPFAANLSYVTGLKYINLENYILDFANVVNPRIINASIEVSDDLTPETFYLDDNVIRRNMSIMPNDNGLFIPDFELLSEQFYHYNDFGSKDLSLVSLKNCVPDVEITDRINQLSTFEQLYLENLEHPLDNVTIGSRYPYYFRTGDVSSNQVSIFNIPNLYYGGKLNPKSINIFDSNFGINLKDNEGLLYRADCLTTQAKWNCVGTVLYDDGFIITQHPSLSLFGKDNFELEFESYYHTIVTRHNVLVSANTLNQSYNQTRPVFDVSEEAYVAITGINLHDKDFNIIAKAQLAQPLVKKLTDKFLIKLKYDF